MSRLSIAERYELYGTAQFDRASYDKWRSGIRFTNAQVASALDAMANEIELQNGTAPTAYRDWAEQCRDGYLSGAALRTALHVLVKKCDICGKTALYRMGQVGRCSAHKDAPTRRFTAYRSYQERKSSVIDSIARQRDIALRVSSRMRAAKACVKGA